MSDDELNAIIERWRLDMARQERVQRVLLIGLAVFTALAFGLLVASMQL